MYYEHAKAVSKRSLSYGHRTKYIIAMEIVTWKSFIIYVQGFHSVLLYMHARQFLLAAWKLSTVFNLQRLPIQYLV